MTAVQSQEKHLQVEVFQEMDRRDETQILAEMRGEQLEEFVYSLNQGEREITNLSYAGVKEAIRRRGQVEILEVRTENDDKEFRALVRVRDHLNKIDVIGAASADRSKPFAWVLAANKAERNAFAKLIPAKWIAILIQEWLERHKKPAGTTVQSQVPQQQKEVILEKGEPTREWKIPITPLQVPPPLIEKGVRQYPLLRGLQSYGMINKCEDEISICPEHPVDLQSPPIHWFIHGTSQRAGVIVPICEKYKLNWKLELDQQGLLKAIVLFGIVLEEKQVQEIVQGATWAFKATLESKEP